MNLLGRKKGNARSEESESPAGAEVLLNGGPDGDQGRGVTTTAPKGRPTPKRSEAARKRGPVAPAPTTAAEARKRKKLNRQSLTKDERKADKLVRRAEMSERREKMMAGDDAYLLPRDKGPVRRLARDVVDARRNVLGLFMPLALGMVFVMLSVPSLAAQGLLSYGMLVLVVVMVVDGVFIGRRVNKLVGERYPDHGETGWKLGFYAASRASQLRRMRAPRPQVNRGDKIS